MNYAMESRIIFLNGIDNNKNIPPNDKDVLKALISNQFQIMGQIIGTFELMCLRERQSVIDARSDGFYAGTNGTETEYNKSGEDYYNEKFKQ